MEKYLRKLLAAAEGIGSIQSLDMGNWIPGKKRIAFTGKTADGKPYELELTVEVGECQLE